MRKNCQRTINAWMNGRPFGKRGDSIWTDGDGIYSYATWIVTKSLGGADPRYCFNDTKYSQTTTTHQNAIRAYMEDYGFNLRAYINIPMGTSYKV